MAIEVSINDLSTWLSNQPDNTVDTPYEITITGLTTSNYNDIRTALNSNSTKYVDLSATSIPSGVTNMSNTFSGCTSLVNAPVIPDSVANMNYTFENCTRLVNAPTIPDGVTHMRYTFNHCYSLVTAPVIPDGVADMDYTFSGCTSLVNAPVIPASVTSMNNTFRECTSLVSAPVIPDGVTSMNSTFSECTSLVSAPVIPDGVTSMNSTFGNCTSLTHKPIIPSTVTTSTDCFYRVTTPNWKGTQSQANSFRSTFFAQTTDSELRVYNDDRVTLEDTICNVDISTLSTYLAGLDPNTVTTAYKVYIRGLTSTNKSSIKTALKANPTKYVDLKYTVLTQAILGEYEYATFTACLSLVGTPTFDNTVVNLNQTFRNCENLRIIQPLPDSIKQLSNGVFMACYSLTEPPVLPRYVEWIDNLFVNCTSLESAPEIPSTVIQMGSTFFGCVKIKQPPILPEGLESINSCFKACYDLETLPAIPSTVTRMVSAFESCIKITSVPVIPNGVTSIESAFRNCSLLATVGANVIPASVTNMENAFTNCAKLTSVSLPNNSSVTNLSGTFSGCTSLVTVSKLPDSVINMDYTFRNCSSIIEIPKVPAVTSGKETFYGCTSLRKIEEFGISASALDSSNFQNMFSGCTSLEQIGHKSEYSDDWHLVYLDFDTNTVQGKIYSRDKSSISITQTNITKNTLSLPLITDELMFSSLISTAALENIIEGTAQQRGMLDTNYSWYGKSVIPPTGDNFIMYAKDPNKFSSNIKFGGGIDVEVVSASKSIMPTQDKREIINTASITLTLDYGATNGVIVEAYAMEDCSITFYKGASITETLSMLAGTRVVFIYFNGWKLCGTYGAVWN